MLRLLATLCALFACLATASVAEAHKKRGHHHHHGKAQHSLRAPVTDDNFYFVMADRFNNGATANDTGGIVPSDPDLPDRNEHGFDPTDTGYYHGGDLRGCSSASTTSRISARPRSGSHRASRTRPSRTTGPVGRLPRLLDHRLHADRPAPGQQRRPAGARRRRPRPRHEGLLRHHHQPYGRRHRLWRQPRKGYISKDRCPYKDAAGNVFDDRDYAGTNTFPPLNPATSFPYTPTLTAADQNVKVPSWLNDRTPLPQPRQHDVRRRELLLRRLLRPRRSLHRASTGRRRDDRHLQVVDHGLPDRRLPDRHDEARQRRVLGEVRARDPRHARRQGSAAVLRLRRGLRTSPSRSRRTSPRRRRSRACSTSRSRWRPSDFAANSAATNELRDFFVDDDWYTDADSNVYQLPTFLGNHDMGRIGMFIRNANQGATDAEVFQRDKLAHELMYLSRGNPVIYYGDEQGFVGDGGDQERGRTCSRARSRPTTTTT